MGGGVAAATAKRLILQAESCNEQVSFESGFKKRKSRRISEIVDGTAALSQLVPDVSGTARLT